MNVVIVLQQKYSIWHPSPNLYGICGCVHECSVQLCNICYREGNSRLHQIWDGLLANVSSCCQISLFFSYTSCRWSHHHNLEPFFSSGHPDIGGQNLKRRSLSVSITVKPLFVFMPDVPYLYTNRKSYYEKSWAIFYCSPRAPTHWSHGGSVRPIKFCSRFAKVGERRAAGCVGVTKGNRQFPACRHA